MARIENIHKKKNSYLYRNIILGLTFLILVLAAVNYVVYFGQDIISKEGNKTDNILVESSIKNNGDSYFITVAEEKAVEIESWTISNEYFSTYPIPDVAMLNLGTLKLYVTLKKEDSLEKYNEWFEYKETLTELQIESILYDSYTYNESIYLSEDDITEFEGEGIY